LKMPKYEKHEYLSSKLCFGSLQDNYLYARANKPAPAQILRHGETNCHEPGVNVSGSWH
jgi:hypothetical protein